VVGRFVNDELERIWKEPVMVCFKTRSEALTVAKVNKIFSGSQPCQLVKNYGRFRYHLCPHHQGINLEYHSGICLDKLKRTVKHLRIADL
jgi:hypothetical protein